MKQKIFNRLTAGVILCFILAANAVAWSAEEKRKTIEKSYKVSEATELYFSNSFGKMHINTWDKNQVDVRIEIIVEAGSESRAQDFLERITIDIDDGDPGRELSFKTNINGKKSGRNTSFEVNYKINMPKRNPVTVKNSFGDVYTGSLSGNAKIDVQYGNLNTESLSGNAEVRLAFGSGLSKIEELTNGELRLSYSKLNVEKMGRVEVNSQFSTLEIERAQFLELTGKYGEIEIEEIDDLEADVNFSGFEVNKLNGSIELDIDYGGTVSIGLSNTIRDVDIQSSFGPLVLKLPPGLNASFEANIGFSDLKYDEEMISFSKVIKDHTSSEYEGAIGNGQGARIDITAKYGSVRLR